MLNLLQHSKCSLRIFNSWKIIFQSIQPIEIHSWAKRRCCEQSTRSSMQGLGIIALSRCGVFFSFSRLVLCHREATAGVQTAAFNLPNDPAVVAQGTLLFFPYAVGVFIFVHCKILQRATSGFCWKMSRKPNSRIYWCHLRGVVALFFFVPIFWYFHYCRMSFRDDQQSMISFQAFFTHILAHELMHGFVWSSDLCFRAHRSDNTASVLTPLYSPMALTPRFDSYSRISTLQWKKPKLT